MQVRLVLRLLPCAYHRRVFFCARSPLCMLPPLYFAVMRLDSLCFSLGRAGLLRHARFVLDSWPNCSKAYGTLNHLNAHVTMQRHGAKRSPNGMCFRANPPQEVSANRPFNVLYAVSFARPGYMRLQSSRSSVRSGVRRRKNRRNRSANASATLTPRRSPCERCNSTHTTLRWQSMITTALFDGG